MTGPPEPEHRDERSLRLGWRMGGLAFEVTSQVAAGALLGWLIDRWLDTAPKGLLTGALLGIAVGLWHLVRGALRLERQLPPPRGENRAGGPNDDA